jgi:hypothetical protein
MPNLIELEISTDPEPEPGLTPLAEIKLDGYVAEAAIRDGRLCVELVDLEGNGEGWCLDFGPVEPRLRA